ncbi:type II toxin-antitoxin system VapB family antitoxin [Leucobacter denitrificans]|uniref:Type II toxin-antitoxin system VapB family antitoxin n=1 Tax=Leucobacter denitrificans TaxID=683042 RepID=A0A7G9S2D8_9MICO|nr:type II toxin-antitoxin system VapB family antitoxin [Leucobacter denitrificans]QNN62013.1 type II toxin-antitoxin system VapB family antitoxin [Leucobacter denitrificans]
MTRTNIEIDDDLIRTVMQRYDVRTKKDAVDLALRRLVGVPLTSEFFKGIKGIGWGADLDEIRMSDNPWEAR